MIGPWITGELISRAGHYYWAFALACAITLIGVYAWTIMIPKVAPLDWSTAE